VPVKRRYVELSPWLLVVAVVVFLLEILERRTGWLFKLFAAKRFMTEPVSAEESEAVTGQSESSLVALLRRATHRSAKREAKSPIVTAKVSPPGSSVAPAKAEPVIPAASSSESTFDALREARERADRRTRKEN
jgi:hypothetical protein